MAETKLIKNHGKSKTFRIIARVLTVIYIIQVLIPLVSIVLMNDRQVILEYARGYFVIYVFCIYFIGLLIGFKWEALGGLLSLLSLMIVYFYSIVFMKLGEGIWVMSFSVLFGTIPCIFYFLSWYFRKSIGRDLKDMGQVRN